jgi:hypothetical protein
MKKIIFCLVLVLLAAPAWATVTITCTPGPGDCDVTISFTNDGDPCVRGFGLDVDTGDANVVEVNCVNADYYVYPGDIDIDASGTVTDWGECVCSGYSGTQSGLGEPNVTIEMISNYVGAPNAPNQINVDLVIITLAKNATVSVDENTILGGVVMEDPNLDPTVITTGCSVGGCGAECLVDEGDQEYTDWVSLGRPDCWCYRKQCRGDIDGITTGPFVVAIPDLTAFKASLNQFTLPPGGECADLDHIKTGPFRVGIPDLTIFKAYLNQFVVPDCDQAPPSGTGPYNFWTN